VGNWVVLFASVAGAGPDEGAGVVLLSSWVGGATVVEKNSSCGARTMVAMMRKIEVKVPSLFSTLVLIEAGVASPSFFGLS